MTSGTPSTGIPRLQELSFLEVAARRVAEGATFEDVRRSLVAHMVELRAWTIPHESLVRLQGAQRNPKEYVRNASAALGELMRLGLLERRRLPQSARTAAAYLQERYASTDAGLAWLERLEADRQGAYDDLLGLLWGAHRQFAGYLRLLGRSMIVIPAASWTAASGGGSAIGEGVAEAREHYYRFLARRVAQMQGQEDLGWLAPEGDVAHALSAYVQERVAAATRRGRPDPYPRRSDVVGVCEEALVRFAFECAGMPLDYTSHEILRRWAKELGVANFSYHVPGPGALRLWSTAQIEEDERGDFVAARRRRLGEWGDRVIDAIPAAYERARRQDPDNTWAPIYRVRAAVCSELRINDPVFDAAVREFIGRQRRPEAPFMLNLDSAQYGSTPPTEPPLRIHSRSGGPPQLHRVMTLVRRTERIS